MSAYADEGDAVIEMDLLPPRWIDIQDEVNERLADIAQKSSRLEKMHAKHVLPSFEEDYVRKKDEAAIEELTQEITRSFRECQKAVQKIETMVREAKQQGAVSQGDEVMAKNIQVSLATRIQDASASFRKKQSAYLNSKASFPTSIMVTNTLYRATTIGRLRVTTSTGLDSTCPEPLHRSFDDGVRCG